MLTDGFFFARKPVVPNGPILRPLLFILYLLPLHSLLIDYPLEYHVYADDISIFIRSDLDATSVANLLLLKRVVTKF